MKSKIIIVIISLIFLGLGYHASAKMDSNGSMKETKKSSMQKETSQGMDMKTPDLAEYEVATFAGGCFWCTESDFEKVNGVKEAVSGYTGGQQPHPSYEEVSSGSTGHAEAVQVYYDPEVVTYKELLGYFWRHINPTDPGGQFVDRGSQYRSEIFYHNEMQKKQAMTSRKALENTMVFDKPIATAITKFEEFYPAEKYHQDYYKKNAYRYKLYRWNSGRDQFLEKTWENVEMKKTTDPMKPMKEMEEMNNSGMKSSTWVRPSDEKIREKLTAMQYKVTQENGTEPPFQNKYWDNKKQGIYVDIVSGEPLFSSTDKFESGTGWPSFTKPIEPDRIIGKEDKSLFMTRTEVRSRTTDSHLGHVFNDGPAPKGLRYCINSAALRFIPKEDLKAEGYGRYLKLF